MKTNNYLTTKEFIKAVEELGLDLTVEGEYEYYVIKDVDDDVIAHINKNVPLQISTDYNGWDDLCDEDMKLVFDLLVAYSSTPIDEREEEKKFYLKHIELNRKNGLGYLNLLRDYYPLDFRLMDKKDKCNWITKFTDKDIEQIRDVYEFNLDDFELVEVKE